MKHLAHVPGVTLCGAQGLIEMTLNSDESDCAACLQEKCRRLAVAFATISEYAEGAVKECERLRSFIPQKENHHA